MNAHSLAKHIRRKYRRLFTGGTQLMRFGRWNSLLGLVEFTLGHLRGKQGIELGSFSGESACVMASAGVRSLICLDDWDPAYSRKHDMELVELRFDTMAAHFPGRIAKIKGDGRESLARLAREGLRVDFVYVDGNHAKESVIADIEAALPVIRKGGLICGHDFGRSIWRGVTEGVRQRLGEPDRRYRDSSWCKRV